MKENKYRMTIQDVAREANVSITTVSRVMNNNYPVSKSTRERVEKVIDKLNYNPSPLARGLIIRKTEAIGVVVPGITNMFFTMVVKGIEKSCKARGYTMLLGDSEGDNQEEMKCVRNLMSRQVDGIIVIDPRTDNMKEGLYEGPTMELPMIFVNGYNEGLEYNFILNDERAGTERALEYLIGLGHRRIAFVRGRYSYSYDIKEEVYKEVLASHNIEVRDDYILNIGEGNSVETVDNASRAVHSMISRGLMPGAFFTCNDLMAVGTLNACKKAMIRIPEDVSIIGFDNIILSELSEPKLTTVNQNMIGLGNQAADMLVDIIEKSIKGNRKLVMDTELIIRSSCSKPQEAQ